MSRIAIVSDTHGSLKNLSLFSDRIGQPDALWHLGDCAEDAPILAQKLNCGYVGVRGNCDPFSDAPLTETIEWHHKRFLLLHGHTVSGRLNMLETVDGIQLINPGSLSRPRSSSGPSMAFLTLTDDAFDVQLLYAK